MCQPKSKQLDVGKECEDKNKANTNVWKGAYDKVKKQPWILKKVVFVLRGVVGGWANTQETNLRNKNTCSDSQKHLVHQESQSEIASDLVCARAKSQELPRKERFLAHKSQLEIAITGDFHRTLKLRCAVEMFCPRSR